MEYNQIEKRHINAIITDIYEQANNLKSKYISVAFEIFSTINLIKKMIEILKKEPSVLEIETENDEKDLVIVGDIHGSLESLINIFQQNGLPPQKKYLFLGDLIDRGNNSCEVIILIYALKYLYNDCVYIIRGNHEFIDMTSNYGFRDECYRRVIEIKGDKVFNKGDEFYKQVIKTFKHLPICAIVNKKIFCVHGGISALIENREELLKLKKVGYQYCSDDSVQVEFLWNDPDNQIETYERSPRGMGCIFGETALSDFLENMEFDLVIRGHQNEREGYYWPFGENNGLLTVFSAVDYCGSSNNGAVVVIPYGQNQEIKICQIESNINNGINNDFNQFIPIPENFIKNNFAFLEPCDLIPNLFIGPDLLIDDV